MLPSPAIFKLKKSLAAKEYSTVPELALRLCTNLWLGIHRYMAQTGAVDHSQDLRNSPFELVNTGQILAC